MSDSAAMPPFAGFEPFPIPDLARGASTGQTAWMDISIIFDLAFTGEANRVAWIIDTPQNRDWFERQTNLNAASAIFSTDRYPALKTAAVQMVWNAQQHSPAWTKVDVIGVPLTDQIAADLDGEGCVTATATGFQINRP
jgi:hypothetical protein